VRFLVSEVPLYGGDGQVLVRAKGKHRHTFEALSPESHGQNLVLTVLYVPYSGSGDGVVLRSWRLVCEVWGLGLGVDELGLGFMVDD